MATNSLRVFLVLVFVQVCLLVAMAASAAQATRPGSGLGPVAVESTPECCLYHPDCCQANVAGEAAAPSPGPWFAVSSAP
ncbi:unnamed protein product [Urochloa decumbens]|uniref:Uncharacterized protein n=1 Tax=Urochloa decumbens TaxID=240449 RepID=A0ABC8Z1Y2_9POAL